MEAPGELPLNPSPVGATWGVRAQEAGVRVWSHCGPLAQHSMLGTRVEHTAGSRSGAGEPPLALGRRGDRCSGASPGVSPWSAS